MKQKIILTRGLPASGKSFWAKQYCIDNPDFKRVNKDDVREKYPDDTWSSKNEKKYLEEERVNGKLYLSQGFSLIVDDTNFNKIHEDFWKEVADDLKCDFEIKVFDTDLKTCLQRNALRAKPVPEVAIRSMYNKYVRLAPKFDDRFILNQDIRLRKAIIVDMDGTLALINGRSPYDTTKVSTDKCNEDLAYLIESWSLSFFDPMGCAVIILSGREDKAMDDTKKWLEDNGIYFTHIFMRKSGDFRPDEVIKKEIYEAEIKDKFYVNAVFDDRNKVVKMWRDLGLLCCQVYYGDF
jgi:predicted kinase